VLLMTPLGALLCMASVLELRMYFLHDGSLNRRGDWFYQRILGLMFHVEMLTLGPLDILLLSRLRRVAFNRDNDICGRAHVEVSGVCPVVCSRQILIEVRSVVDGKFLFLFELHLSEHLLIELM
jgi:hypothetical protein